MEQLAVAVRNQWDAEATLRRVNDPYPLPVAWRAAPAELAVPWAELKDVARAWPGGPPGDPARWPQDAAGLNGQDGALGEVFSNRVPTRRLVILGEPGAGKSVLLVRLLQDLLARRAEDDPVPVLFSLASWNPHEPLKRWLADQLRGQYPGLRATVTVPTSSGTAGDLAEALLESDRILPLLDGFDELPEHLHPLALDALNRALPARRPLVLAARSTAYRAAVSGQGPTLRLNGAAVVQLLPPDPERVATYLHRDAGGPHTPGAARWNAVIDQLGTDSPVGQALSTPLGLFLARTIYNPRPGTGRSHPVPHPDELCDRQAFPDRAAVAQHLFRSFIPAAYAPDGPQPSRWSAAQAQRAFIFLARFQESHCHGSPDLAWWELRRAVPRGVQCLVGGLVLGLLWWGAAGAVGDYDYGTVKVLSVVSSGTAGAITGMRAYGRSVSALLFGLVGVTVGGLVFFLVDGTASFFVATNAVAGCLVGVMLGCLVFRPFRRSAAASAGPQRPREGLIGGLWGLTAIVATALGWVLIGYDLVGVFLGGLCGGLAGEVTGRRVRRQVGGFAVGFTGGAVGGWPFEDQFLAAVLAGLVCGGLMVAVYGTGRALTSRTPDLRSGIGASRLFTTDRRAFLLVGLVLAAVTGAVFGLVFATPIGDEFGLGSSTATVGIDSRIMLGVMTGAAIAPMLGTAAATWPHLVIARTYLAMRRRLPRELMAFLQDAHDHRGVLRQVGHVYQFRHIDLQRHLGSNAER
ncbi:NACHT domain-containing protein [Streptomyces sp. KN37]|uniref:NACHT domain-containing protein n=1 Tax=Streptomyces sp. KN37 TaxID=3090667 RepID=UPI002A755018|nr:NACHT domain-containing protein [Streptomyces sp. KN37]WPO69484.1 NACHT domain-containing protein [Streptomyces sp. KN37]